MKEWKRWRWRKVYWRFWKLGIGKRLSSYFHLCSVGCSVSGTKTRCLLIWVGLDIGDGVCGSHLLLWKGFVCITSLSCLEIQMMWWVSSMKKGKFVPEKTIKKKSNKRKTLWSIKSNTLAKVTAAYYSHLFFTFYLWTVPIILHNLQGFSRPNN